MSEAIHSLATLCAMSLFWTLIVVAGASGLTALVSPRAFRTLAAVLDRPCFATPALPWVERPVDLDTRLQPHLRVLGGAAVAASLLLASIGAAC